MGAKGFNLAYDGHLVMQNVPATDINGAAVHYAVINMEAWNHLDYVVFFGTSPRAAAVITIGSCSNWVTLAGSPTTETAIPFTYNARILTQSTDGNDVDGASTAVTVAATGLIPEAGTPNNILYIISLDSSQLISGHIGFRLNIANAGAACTTTVFAICSGARYAGEARPTVLSV